MDHTVINPYVVLLQNYQENILYSIKSYSIIFHIHNYIVNVLILLNPILGGMSCH